MALFVSSPNPGRRLLAPARGVRGAQVRVCGRASELTEREALDGRWVICGKAWQIKRH